MLCLQAHPMPWRTNYAGELVEVNSGGQVLFCFFSPPVGMHFAQDRLLVLKFHPSRLQTQSEQFANELTRHLGICAPNCRILRATVSKPPLFASFPGMYRSSK